MTAKRKTGEELQAGQKISARKRARYSEERLAAFLNIGVTKETLRAFFKSDGWKGHWDEYTKDYIDKLKQSSEDGKMARGAELNHAPQALKAGEAAGQQKFGSVVKKNKKNRDVNDHVACFIYKVYNFNTKSLNGLFYNRHLSEDDTYRKIWKVFSRAKLVLAKKDRYNLRGTEDNNDQVNDPEEVVEVEQEKLIVFTTQGAIMMSWADNRPEDVEEAWVVLGVCEKYPEFMTLRWLIPHTTTFMPTT